jgi:hypothetical protein
MMAPETLAGIVGIVIVAYYLLWRFTIVRHIFWRARQRLRDLRETKS